MIYLLTFSIKYKIIPHSKKITPQQSHGTNVRFTSVISLSLCSYDCSYEKLFFIVILL